MTLIPGPPGSDTGAAAISTGVASAGAGVVEDRAAGGGGVGEDGARARGPAGVGPPLGGVVEPRPDPVDPAAAAAGDCAEVARLVTVDSSERHGSRAFIVSGSGPWTGPSMITVGGRARSSV